MKGFTLIETVVVVGIISIMALFGVESITSFQKTAALDSAANEFVSILKLAQNKSRTSELLAGELPEKFETDGTDGFPKYGVKISGSNYLLIREYQLDGATDPVQDELQTFPVDERIEILADECSADCFVLFSRLTSQIDESSTTDSFTIQTQDEKEKRQAVITESGVINLGKI